MRSTKHRQTAILCILLASQALGQAWTQEPLQSDIELHFGGLGTDGANAIAPLSDGGFALGGWKSKDGSIKVTEGWILRVDARGGYVWDIILPNSAPYGVTTLSAYFDGGLLAIDSEIGQAKGTTRLSKLSPEGTIEWQQEYGRSNRDVISSIKPTFDGGLIMAGQTAYRSSGPLDGWLLKLDRNQNVEWLRTLGGEKEDAFEDVALAPDGGYVAVGWTTLPSDKVLGWSIKLDTNGATKWSNNLDLGFSTELHGILPAPDGSFLFAASKAAGTSSDRESVIGGLEPNGSVTWQHTIVADGEVVATGIAHSTNGSYLVSASIEDRQGQAGLVAGFEQSGRIQFMHRFSRDGNHRALAVTSSATGHGYAVTGSSQRTQALDQDAWLLVKRDLPTKDSTPQELAP